MISSPPLGNPGNDDEDGDTLVDEQKGAYGTGEIGTVISVEGNRVKVERDNGGCFVRQAAANFEQTSPSSPPLTACAWEQDSPSREANLLDVLLPLHKREAQIRSDDTHHLHGNSRSGAMSAVTPFPPTVTVVESLETVEAE